MLPVVILGGLLIVRKLQLGQTVAVFLAASLVTVWAVSLLQGIRLAARVAAVVSGVARGSSPAASC